MSGTTEMLRSTLGEKGYAVLLAVASRTEPASGRSIATELDMSPTTASSRLGKLQDAGFVHSSRAGRSHLWRLNTDNNIVRAWLREGHESGTRLLDAGSSPVSTGGGGVTFERKVAAQYLGWMLLGHGAVGLGAGRSVVSVAFQQAPSFSVDDLVIGAAEEGEDGPSLVMALAARRTPNLVASDEKSRALVRAFVHQLVTAPAGGPELALGLAAAGMQEHVRELAVLARMAANQSDAGGFLRLVQTPRKFTTGVCGRLDHIVKLVRLALIDLGMPDPSIDVVEQWAWEFLAHLSVLAPRLETPDDSDWLSLANGLIPVARGTNLYGGTQLRDRLLTLADDYAPSAATVNPAMLRRAAHDMLELAVRRHRGGWRALEGLDRRARAAVRGKIVSANGDRQVRVDRSDVAEQLLRAVRSGSAVVVHGDSGVGKSELVLNTLAMEVGASAVDMQTVCVNLRHMPPTVLEVEAALDVRFGDLLDEMASPIRMLVIDGADAVAEWAQEILTYMVGAAAAADVTVVVVTANDAKQFVLDTVTEQFGQAVIEVSVPSLTDAQIDAVVAVFGELEPMAANPRSRDLLRRPVVVDLLVRGGLRGAPVSDFDAMEQIWAGLVRRGADGGGSPDLRDVAMQKLARWALQGGDELEVVGSMDPTALEGLRRDGLLRTSIDDPFRIGPEFAHDEVRRYAVARLLLAGGDPAQVLRSARVPRWALGAARLTCQALLTAPNSISNPFTGRFWRLQAMFEGLASAGYGERWADVPGEALLTLGDEGAVLRDAWPQLRADDGAGLQQLIRLVDQRLRDQAGFVRVVPVQPLVDLLLDEEMPWRSSEGERTVLREWLRALVAADTPEGYPPRIRLRTCLLNLCAAADERLRVANEVQAAVRAAITLEERERTPKTRGSLSILEEIGYPRSRRRRSRPEISSEITDKTVVEFFALLGPDLGSEGEAVLRRVADAAPDELSPAMEGPMCGRALAGWRRGFLAEMTLAYYLDEEDDGTGGYGPAEGVRDHRGFGFGMPLAAWYRGPFMPLLQTDFRGGVTVLNQILNHAALVRARTLARNYESFGPLEYSDLDRYRTELTVTGTTHDYAGDSSVWNWYRGTGVGPYPCMSALQALERVCDQFLVGGAPLSALISTLLTGCDNLAMVAVAVGVLVRHLEVADHLLDRFLAEPAVWHLEFARVAHEYGGLRASSEGIVAAERRQWSLRNAAMSLVLAADLTRADELRQVGHQLVEKVRRQLEQAGGAVNPTDPEIELNTARAWASGLDRGTYLMRQTDEGVFIESRPPVEVLAALATGQDYILRSKRSMHLNVRYYIDQKNGRAKPFMTEELVADLQTAAQLLDEPLELDAMGWDAPAMVAAAALDHHLVHGLQLPDDSIKFAASIILRIGEGDLPQRQWEYEESYFEQGADRSAARVIPLMLTAGADGVRRVLDGGDGSVSYARAEAAATALAHAVPHETRMHLARGLDRVWESPCDQSESCQHHVGLRLATETMRDCVIGPWNDEQERVVEVLDDPITETLPSVPALDVYVACLDAAIHTLAPAAVAGICVSRSARELLNVLLNAHRRALLAQESGSDDRGTHSLVAARALLTLNDDEAILRHVDAYVDNSKLMYQVLRAISAAAEESPERAVTGCRIWPDLVARVLAAHDEGHAPFETGTAGQDYTLAALLPNPAGDMTYLYQELADKPIVWWDPIAWQPIVDRWLDHASGRSTCIDHLISYIAPLPTAAQARTGLPWVARAVLANPAAVAERCYLLTTWLVDIRTSADDAGLSSEWQRVVDALVVAGETRLAPYSE